MISLVYETFKKVALCDTKTSSNLIDVIPTNRVRSFRHSKTVETGFSDFHKLVMTSFRSTYQRVRPTRIRCRSYKTFDENAFLADLRTCPFHKCFKLSFIKRIEDKLNHSSSFSFREATTAEIIKVIKALNINSATGIDTIPPKLVVMSS